MGAMATWEDGPEYAPAQRPREFAAPRVGPLQQHPIEASPGSPGVPSAAQLPAGVPAFSDARGAAPLHVLGHTREAGRDPREAYRSASAALTPFDVDGGPRRAAGPDPAEPAAEPPHELDATAPLGPPPAAAAQAFAGPAAPAPAPPPAFPAPGTPQWFGPGAPPAPRAPAPGLPQLISAVTPAVAIMLALAGLILPLSLPLYIVAMFASTRIRYRKRAVRNVFLGGLGFTLVLSLVRLMVSADSFGSWWGAMSQLSMLASWGVLIVLGFVVAGALQSREQPDRP